jgi:hypothetical protein
MGAPAEIAVSVPPVNAEQTSGTSGADRPATPGNAPAIDPDSTFIEDQSPYADTILEAPLSSVDAAEIARARVDLKSADSDATFIEDQSAQPDPNAPAKFNRPDFYVDTVGANDEPIPLVIPKTPATMLQRIRSLASRIRPGR